MRRLWRTTSGLVAIVALMLALATLAIGIVAYEVTHEALEQQLDHRIAAETAGLMAEAHRDGLPALVAAIARREASRSTSSLDYLLVDERGGRLAGSLEAQVPSREGFEEFLHYHRPGSAEAGIAQALTTRVPGGMLVVAADRSDLDEIDRTLASLFIGSLAAVLIVGLMAAAVVGWLTQRRLNRIDTAAQAIIAGNLGSRIVRDGSGSEFDRLAETLNHMLDRIEGLMDNLRQVSGDIAHDLRTPLTRLYGSLDLAAGEADAAARSGLIEKARGQASELLEIFASLLRIAEIEGLAERLPRSRVDLSALLVQMAETYMPDFEDSGRTLHCSIPPGLTVDGDRRLLSQAVANLLDNCLRHTPRGTSVELAARQEQEELVLTVSDDGPGVGEEEPSRLFRRFVRADRSRHTQGHGLGLSMVQAIANAHGGVADILPGQAGFAVALRIPVHPANVVQTVDQTVRSAWNSDLS